MNARRLFALVLALACVTSAACRGVRHDEDDWGHSLLLAESELADGTSTSWRLYAGPGRGNAPRVEVTRTTVSERPRVGLSVSSVTRRRAEESGIHPFEGVWVDSVDMEGPAGRAGLVARDVILSVGGQEVASAEQFSDLIRNRGQIGEPLEMVLRVVRRPGDPISGPASAAVTVVPESRRDRNTSTESVELDFSPALQTYTGLQVGVVPPDLAARAYDAEETVVTVSGVVTGSPAYRAGFRRGDRLKSCDGKPVTSLDDVRAALYRRIRDRGWPLEDLVGQHLEGELDASGPIVLSVEGPLGVHEATLAIDRDMREVVDIDIPILFEYSRTVDSKRVSFLDFIFQFGFNYRRDTLASHSRGTVDTWKLSLFPFGMFEFAKRRRSSEWTLFWFIDFEVSRD